jgi:hypothetical protein
LNAQKAIYLFIESVVLNVADWLFGQERLKYKMRVATSEEVKKVKKLLEAA